MVSVAFRNPNQPKVKSQAEPEPTPERPGKPESEPESIAEAEPSSKKYKCNKYLNR